MMMRSPGVFLPVGLFVLVSLCGATATQKSPPASARQRAVEIHNATLDQLEKDQDWQKASGGFLRALSADPTYALPRYNLARCAAKLGKREEAIKWYRSFLAADPTSPFAARAKEAIAQLEPPRKAATEPVKPPPVQVTSVRPTTRATTTTTPTMTPAPTLATTPATTPPQPPVQPPPATIAAKRTITVPDDFASVRAAMDASRPGDTVRVRAGTYTEAVKLKDGVTLVGEGRDSILRCDPAEGPVISVADCRAGGIAELTLEHVDGTAAAAAEPAPALLIADATIKVADCLISGAAGPGIRVSGRAAPAITKCSVTDSAGHGIEVVGEGARPQIESSNASANRMCGILFADGAKGTVARSWFEANGHDAIAAAGAGTSPVLRNNHCKGSRGHGINLHAGAGATGSGNVCEYNAAHGIAASDPGTNVLLRENTCRDNGGDGIALERGCTALAERNWCERNGRTGIAAALDSRVTVRRNTCKSNRGAGIYLGRGVSGLVEGNTCEYNEAASIANESPLVMVGENSTVDAAPAGPPQDAYANPGAQSCFVATAAYGTPWEPNVVTLRAFRDRYLLSSRAGRWLVRAYYRLSPPVADVIASSAPLRFLVRRALTPAVVVAGACLGDVASLVVLVSPPLCVAMSRARRTSRVSHPGSKRHRSRRGSGSGVA